MLSSPPEQSPKARPLRFPESMFSSFPPAERLPIFGLTNLLRPVYILCLPMEASRRARNVRI
jgi:hypothetical protein